MTAAPGPHLGEVIAVNACIHCRKSAELLSGIGWIHVERTKVGAASRDKCPVAEPGMWLCPTCKAPQWTRTVADRPVQRHFQNARCCPGSGQPGLPPPEGP